MPKKTLVSRMIQVLSLLCDEPPPEKIVWAWIEHDDLPDDPRWIGPPLQDWVNCHCKVSWPLSLDVIDAVQMIADSIREGEDEDERMKQP